MPRKKTNVGDAAGLKVTQIVDWFRKANLIAADVALDLAQETVGGRHKEQNKAAERGAAGGKTIATTAVAGATTTVTVETKARKKPGPPKGFRKGGKAGGATANSESTPAELTGTALPAQTAADEGLPLSDEPEPVGAGAPVHVG